jgi:hypothetical protein
VGERNAQIAPNGVGHESRKLDFDVANSVNQVTMGALLNLVPVSQIMFGSDYP